MAATSSVRLSAAVTLDDAGLAASVVRLTNVARLAAGRRPLKRSTRLDRAAQLHAADMAERSYFSHTSQDGRSWERRIRSAGYRKPAGENIARGQVGAVAVLKAWMASPGHRRNILDRDFRFIGVGYTRDGQFWVQDFGY